MKVSPSPRCGPDAATFAAGLACPKAYGDYLILDILRKSRGIALAVTDEEIMDALRNWARVEGIFAAPEGQLRSQPIETFDRAASLVPTDKVVLFNTGTGLKYLDTLAGVDSVAQQKLPTSPPHRRDHRAILKSQPHAVSFLGRSRLDRAER